MRFYDSIIWFFNTYADSLFHEALPVRLILWWNVITVPVVLIELMLGSGFIKPSKLKKLWRKINTIIAIVLVETLGLILVIGSLTVGKDAKIEMVKEPAWGTAKTVSFWLTTMYCIVAFAILIRWREHFIFLLILLFFVIPALWFWGFIYEKTNILC